MTSLRNTACGRGRAVGAASTKSKRRADVFLDYAEINIKAGDGGPGASSFRRESFAPMGGPNGGDGGRGGDVVLRADGQMATLLDYRYRQQYAAPNGNKGEGTNSTG